MMSDVELELREALAAARRENHIRREFLNATLALLHEAQLTIERQKHTIAELHEERRRICRTLVGAAA